VAPETDILWYLRVERRDAEGLAVVICAGRVSNRTCPELETALAAAADEPTRGLILDLTGVDYISSSGLRAMESTSARLAASGRPFVVCGVRESLSVAFDLAGLARGLAIEPSLEAALARCEPSWGPPSGGPS